MKSANAARDLPADLLHRLQKYVEGRLLWVPVRERRRGKTSSHPARDVRIRNARKAGALLRQIAQRELLSVNRISQICAGLHPTRKAQRRIARRSE